MRSSRRRWAPDRADGGFTLIELIVAMSLIAILAAIAAPTYAGLQSATRDGSVRSALVSDRTALIGWQINNNGNVPSAVAFNPSATGSGLTSYGWTASPDWTAYQYVTSTINGQALWCLQATSLSGAVYRVSVNKTVAQGTCATLGGANY